MIELHGVIPALLTPFQDQAVNFNALANLVEFLLEAGVGGLYITGTSGEWFRLTMDERKAIAEQVVAQVAHRVPVVVHVGHFCTASAVALAEHAARIGADLVASVLPGRAPGMGLSLGEVAAYYRAIGQAKLPMMAYYLDGSSSPFDPRSFVEEIGGIEGMIGLKYTGADLFPMQMVRQLSLGRLKVWGGHDQMAAASFLMGADGVIGTSYNYMPGLMVSLYRAFKAGRMDEIMCIQANANSLAFAVKQFGQGTAYKAVLEMRGLSGMGSRAPSLPLSEAKRQALADSVLPFSHLLEPIQA